MPLQHNLEDVLVVPSSPEPLERTRSTFILQPEDGFNITDDQSRTDGQRRPSLRRLVSSQSSISSFPASVIHHQIDDSSSEVQASSHSRRAESPLSPNLGTARSVFRHPSSIRALQMESELESDVLSPRCTSRVSRPYFSRSSGSSYSPPVKRTSRSGTPRRTPKPKKEFPLVLLHCTLLPAVVTPAAAGIADDIVEAVLPEEYRPKWRLLRDKLWGNNELRQRGVLIPHPREDYGLLEERLLDTLELERPRVRQGHFIPVVDDATDSGIGSEYPDSEPGAEQGDQCPDCGCSLASTTERKRQWRVKVYAANGLMSSGAWTAAWQEMEKVDVEIGIWMPNDIQTEVEERLTAVQAKQAASRTAEHGPVSNSQRKGRERGKSERAKLKQEERMKEIYGGRNVQDEINSLIDDLGESTAAEVKEGRSQPPLGAAQYISSLSLPVISLTYLKHQVQVLLHNQRNIAIILLSLLVLCFSLQATTSSSSHHVAAAAAKSSISQSITSSISVRPSPPSEVALSNTETNTFTATPLFDCSASSTVDPTEKSTQRLISSFPSPAPTPSPALTAPQHYGMKSCFPPSIQVLLELSGQSSSSSSKISPAHHNSHTA